MSNALWVLWVMRIMGTVVILVVESWFKDYLLLNEKFRPTAVITRVQLGDVDGYKNCTVYNRRSRIQSCTCDCSQQMSNI